MSFAKNHTRTIAAGQSGPASVRHRELAS